ncbi:MAG: hypothetical protein K9M96_09385 [Deltaproteobacteria bacterium]|nr:hypothetical protein [Desulfobacterales bacterium]MCF8083296.1 hypothetical protein [Deltaproteobacteria bacterium]
MYRVDLETVFAPKQLRVSESWLSALTWDNNNHIAMQEIARVQTKRCQPLDEAVATLEQKWTAAREELPKETIPIYCLHDVNPFIEGVCALLIPDLPSRIEKQLASLQLRNPVNLRSQVGPETSGVLGKTVVDFTPDRLIAIGNARWFCKSLGTLGERITILRNPAAAVSQIKDMLCAHNLTPVGSSLLIGGLGTVFAFEAAFLVTRIQGIDLKGSAWLLIACVLSLLGILAFLVQEAFESHIVAFCPWWTVKTKIISWVVFLAMLLVSPICFFVPVDSRLLCQVIRWAGLLLMGACAVTSFGQIFFQAGLSKRFALIWWLTIICFVITLPLLDLIPSQK